MKYGSTFRALVAFLSFLLLSCTRSNEFTHRGTVLGLEYEVRVVAKADRHGELATLVLQSLRQTEQTLSADDAGSELSQFNASEKLQWLPASRSLVQVVEEALRVAKQTDGAWDPTAGQLALAYRQAKDGTPGPATLAAAKSKVGYHHLEFRHEPLGLKKSRRGLLVDLRSLAPGFAVDEVCEALRKKGFANFQVRVGTSTRAAGTNGLGEVWPYRFQKPLNAEQAPLHLTTEVIALSNRAAATMALPDAAVGSERLIDPRSGQRLTTDLLNVTVLDLSALRAQAYALGFFSLNASGASELARKQGMAAFFVSQKEEKGIAEATPFFPPAITPTP